MAYERAYRTTALVGPGHRIELVAPELMEGDRVEIVLLTPSENRTFESDVLASIESLGLQTRTAEYWAEREQELKESRDSWDR